MSDELKSTCLSLIAHHSSFIIPFQISAGDLSEWARPAVFALAALVSAWVFHDARRREGFGPAAVWAWALLTLLFPPAVLPLYLAARLYTRRAAAEHSHPTEDDTKTEDAREGAGNAAGAADARAAGGEGAGGAPAGVGDAGADEVGADEEGAVGTRAGPGLWPSLAYAVGLCVLGVVYFYADYRGFDARLARAERAKLYGHVETAIAEYRGALRVREDGRTRQLLGLELLRAGRAEEALAELRAAAAGPDPDGALHFDTGNALEALARREEAAAEYRRFLAGPLCAQPAPEPRCEAARARLRGAGAER